MPEGGHGATFFVAVYTLRLEGLDGGSKAAGIARVDPQEAHMARVLPGKKYLGESYTSFLVFCCSTVVLCSARGKAAGSCAREGIRGWCSAGTGGTGSLLWYMYGP